MAEVGTGAIFGELALLGKKGKRNATVTAKGPSELRLLSLEGDVVKNEPKLDDWRKELEREVSAVRKEHEVHRRKDPEPSGLLPRL